MNGHCDFCAKDLRFQPYVDGKTTRGPWATMCLPCYKTHGVGLGTGKGQRYNEAGKKVEG